MVLGPYLGGSLAEKNLSYPFYLAAALSLVVLVFVALMLPESLATEHRITAGKTLRGPDFKAMWHALFGPLGFLMSMSFLVSFGLTNFESIFGLYALDKFGFSPVQVGTILMVIGLTGAIVQGVFTGVFSKRWGENWVMRGALFVSVIGFLLMLTATDLPSVIITTAFFVVGNTLLRPVLASLISQQSERTEQGAALGMHNSFMSLGRVVGPTWAGFVFDVNMALPFISGAIIMTVALALAFIWLKKPVPLSVRATHEPKIVAAE